MRISDWSSDVCSSDLARDLDDFVGFHLGNDARSAARPALESARERPLVRKAAHIGDVANDEIAALQILKSELQPNPVETVGKGRAFFLEPAQKGTLGHMQAIGDEIGRASRREKAG